MRILVHDFSGHPFQIQLSRALAARGDDVLHAYCGDIQTPKGPLARRRDDPVGFTVRDLGRGTEFPKYRLARRVVNESRYAQRLATRAARVPPRCRPALERSSGRAAADRARVPAGAAFPSSCGCKISTRSGCRCCSGNGSGRFASVPSLVADALERGALRGCAAIVVDRERVRRARAPRRARVDTGALHRELGATHRLARAAQGEPAELPVSVSTAASCSSTRARWA